MSNQPDQPDQPEQPPRPPQPPGSPQPPPSTPGGGDEPPIPGAGGAPPPQGGGYGAPPPQDGYGSPPSGYGAPGGGQLSQQDERTWGMLAHISAILAAIIGLSFLGPLVVLLVQGPKSQFVRRQSVEALNFQITTYIALLVSFILVFVLIGFVMLVVVGIAWLVLTIMAGIAANNGQDYRYPVNLRLVK